MKNWTSPVFEELDVKVTEYDPNSGRRNDAVLRDENTGDITKYLYGPSTGDSGVPTIVLE